MAKGKCPRCGKTFIGKFEGDIIVCDCWRYCPICGAEMQSYTPDLTPHVYGMDDKRELKILMVCMNHTPPFYSTQKPVEAVCTWEA